MGVADFARALAGAIALLAFAVPHEDAQAQAAAPQASTTELAALLDRIMPAAMSKHHAPGAVVSVVSNCEIVFARGYGHADLASGRPMDPERTFFRIGSIAKVVTATIAAIMAGHGDLDLDRDVQDYLPEGLLRTRYEAPITLKDLLAHTAGYGETWTGLGVDRVGAILPLEQFLRDFQPPQLRPPRTAKIYNSTAFAIAALAMERVSGQEFAALTQKLLFEPAQMNTQTQVLADWQIPDLAIGYSYDGEGYRAHPRDIYLHIAPGGDGVATSVDLSQLLKAHLGCPTAAPVLSPAGLRAMQGRYFSHDPAVAGMALGWEEFQWKGRTWLKKPGGAPGMTTFVALLPGSQVGFFIGVNADQSPLWRSVMIPLADRFALHAEHRELPRAAGRGVDARAYAGWYRSLRLSPYTYEKIFGLRQVQVVADGAERLHFRGRTFNAVSDTLFQSDDHSVLLGFRLHEDGRPGFVFQDGGDAYEALLWWESLPAHVAAVVLFSLAFAIVALLAWRQSRRRRTSAAGHAGVFTLAAAVAAANLGFIAGMAASMATLDIWTIQLDMPWSIRLSLLLPLIATALLIALCWSLWRAAGKRRLARGERVLLGAAVLCAALFLLYLMYWNLFGYFS